MDSKRSSRPVNREAGSNPPTDTPESATLFGFGDSDQPTASEVPPSGSEAESPNGNGSDKGPEPVANSASNIPSDPEPGDEWDLDKLRVSQDFAGSVGVQKILTTIPVRKPEKTWFVRTHPDPAYRLRTLVLELKDERETYIIAPSLQAELITEPAVSTQLLIAAINRQDVPFLWPIRLPGPDGKSNPWNDSAMEAASRAESEWVRVTSNQNLGAYEVWEATAPLPPPEWPDLSFKELLKIAFRGRMIDSREHPVLQRLRGEV